MSGVSRSPDEVRAMRIYGKNVVLGLLAFAWLALVGWQVIEHSRAKESARQELTKRADDKSDTLAVVIRSSARFGMLQQPRLEAALQGLAKQQEVRSVALLNSVNEVVARAGEPIQLDPAKLKSGADWSEKDRMKFFRPVDLGELGEDRRTTRSTPIIVSDEPGPEGGRGGRGGPPDRRGGAPDRRGGPERRGPGGSMMPPPVRQSFERTTGTVTMRWEYPPDVTSQTLEEFTREMRARRGPERGPRPPEPLHQSVERTSSAVILTMVFPQEAQPTSASTAGPGREPGREGGPPPGPPRRWGRPPMMDEARYQELLQKKGLHGFVLVMSTDTIRAENRRDFWLRLIIAGVGLLAVGGLGLAWRNLDRSAQLQVRLIRASEMNSHLREMNLAAAGLAHETRNPLNIVRGLAQMISRQPEAPPEIRNRATQITDEVDRVTGRLNEFIEYSRPREAKPGPVDFAALVEDVARTLETDREEKAIDFRYEGPRLTIEADELLLRQVLFNLLLNAVQAVEKGGHVAVAVDRSPSNGAWFEVRDSGRGVPANMREDVFRPYFSTQGNGAGLGLAVVRQIVQAHGWDIGYVSSAEGGARFRVSGLKVVSRNL
jgi:signal transduction histidine kinase